VEPEVAGSIANSLERLERITEQGVGALDTHLERIAHATEAIAKALIRMADVQEMPASVR
jgi:hypothetical protein